jgi:hypothetical protein
MLLGKSLSAIERLHESDDGNHQGTPKLISGSSRCNYVFEWATSAACPSRINAGMIVFWV